MKEAVSVGKMLAQRQGQGQEQTDGQAEEQRQGSSDSRAYTKSLRSVPIHGPMGMGMGVRKNSTATATAPKRFPALHLKGDLSKGMSSSSSSSGSRSRSMIRSRGGSDAEQIDMNHTGTTAHLHSAKSLAHTHTSEAPRQKNKNKNVLQFSEWGWSDKELVLKILFAKIHESKHHVGGTSKDFLHDSVCEGDIGMHGHGDGDGGTERGDEREDRREDRGYELPFFVSEGAVDCMSCEPSSYQAAVITRKNFNATY